jgi:Short C-terminal domain
MFGHHPRLERELRKRGKRAFATVVESHRTHYAETTGNPGIISDTRILWKLVLRVEPEGEPAFEAKLDALFGQLTEPTADTQLPVLYDPKDHSKVVLDRSEEGGQALVNHMTQERTDAMVARMRERGQDEIADRYQAVHDAGLTTNWSSDPAERRRQIQERQAQIKEIMGGQNVLVGGQPLPPAAAAALAAATGASGTSGATDAAATADALGKLADLRDRGALTDAEFEAQKKKLLGE